MITAADPLSEVLSRLDGVRPRGDRQYMAKCPGHDDRHASLSVGVGQDGRVLLKCQAGCTIEHVCESMGIHPRDLFVPRVNGNGAKHAGGNGKLGRIAALYDYVTRDGELLYQVVRYDPKDFRQRRPDGRGGWVWSLGDVDRVLYQTPQLMDADPADWVFLSEGEKDVDNLIGAGLVATTNVGGAGKWRPQYSEALRGRRVCILPHNDDKGEAHTKQAAASLAGVAADVRIIHLPNLPPKGDVSDWLEAGGTADALRALADTAPETRNEKNEKREKARRFELTPLSDMLAEPLEEENYVWDKTLIAGGLSIDAAKPKVGKSTLARGLAIAVANGDPFLGRATRQGSVVYLALEEKRSEVIRAFSADL